MPGALRSYKIDPDGKIRTLHIFYAASEAAAERLKEQHADGCKAFGPAVANDQTEDVWIEGVEPPEVGDLADYADDVPDDDAGDDEEEEGEEGGEG